MMDQLRGELRSNAEAGAGPPQASPSHDDSPFSFPAPRPGSELPGSASYPSLIHLSRLPQVPPYCFHSLSSQERMGCDPGRLVWHWSFTCAIRAAGILQIPRTDCLFCWHTLIMPSWQPASGLLIARPSSLLSNNNQVVLQGDGLPSTSYGLQSGALADGKPLNSGLQQALDPYQSMMGFQAQPSPGQPVSGFSQGMLGLGPGDLYTPLPPAQPNMSLEQLLLQVTACRAKVVASQIVCFGLRSSIQESPIPCWRLASQLAAAWSSWLYAPPIQPPSAWTVASCLKQPLWYPADAGSSQPQREHAAQHKRAAGLSLPPEHHG